MQSHKSIAFILFCIAMAVFVQCRHGMLPDGNYQLISTYPLIDPDYTQLIIPPNIAPMNFRIREPANGYFVKIYSTNSGEIRISNQHGKISIPEKQWKRLLENNHNQPIFIDVYAKRSDGWVRYQTIRNQIAEESIDSHVVYRLINPGYVGWDQMGIYQRNIETFDESPVFTNQTTQKNCMNCHAFCNQNPDQMLFHMRASFAGTIFCDHQTIRKVNTKTPHTLSAGVYPAWHPDGRHVAFSVNNIYQRFHRNTDESIYVFDTFSNLIIYDTQTNQVTTSPAVSTERLENVPNWSPDGKFLYYGSAEKQPDMQYNDIRYDLMRIAYDVQTNTWGTPEPVLLASKTSQSISFPKVSPDGRFLLFSMSDYGYFHVNFKSSDLYLMNLETGEIVKPNINSDLAESYHSWSSNSRWFVFVSKRRDGLCSRLYFAHMDTNGQVSKPFLLPPKDPDFYDTFLKNYNVPEMVYGSVKVDRWKLMKVAKEGGDDAQFDPAVDVDAITVATQSRKMEGMKKY